MSAAEHASFWSTEAKMISAASCNYNYCTSGDSWVYHDMISRTRPEYSLPFPRSGKPYGGMAARFQNKASAAYSSGLLMEKPYLFGASLASLQSRDQKDCAEHCKINSLNPEHLSDDLLMENGSYFKREDAFTVFNGHHDFSNRYQPIEEPWLSSSSLPSSFADKKFDASSSLIDKDEKHEFLESDTSESTSHVNDHNIMTDSISQCQNMYFDMLAEESSSHLYERDQPLEEPWLLSSFLISSESAGTSISAASSSKHPEKDVKTLLEHQEQYHHISDKLLSDGEDNLTSHEKSFFTEILINSSVCTMQRIAILEDGKLVELLLEPVKTNVQCDSVYLGVVTKLVPNMGGAFVNIGNSRPSLMDIRHNREPFIFPPFATAMKGKTSSSICAEHSASSQSGNTVSDGAVVSEHDTEEDFLSGPVSYQPDDFEDYEDEDDVDAEEVQMGNVSCSVLDIDGIESVSQGITTAFSGYGSNMSDHPDFRMSSAHEVKEYEDVSTAKEMWAYVRKGTKIIVQVVKEGLGTKGPTLTAYPKLRSRFWVLIARCNNIGVSKKISGVERTRLKVIAKTLQPAGFGLTVRTVAEGHSVEELKKDLNGLLSTWRTIMEHAKSAALAADEGVEGAVPAILHQAMGQTLSVVQDYFNEKVKRMIVDSPRTYHEVTNYLQDIAPNLCDSVELHAKKVPLFDEFNIEDEINDILNKRVPLPNGGSLVIEQTEALVSIDVNGGHGMLGHGTSQEKAILDVNLAAAKKIARELRLRDIGGIIVVDFIDMVDESNKRLVYEEVKKAVERDRSTVRVSELSKHGLMEITRKRVRPSVTFMISEPCTCCHATGRVEASETSFSKIEHEICRLLAMMKKKADPENPKSWPKLILRVDSHMCDYLTSGKKTRLATLSSSLRVWILLKVARNFSRGAFEVRLITDDKVHNNHNQVDMSMVRPIETGTTLGKRSKLFPVKKWKMRGK